MSFLGLQVGERRLRSDAPLPVEHEAALRGMMDVYKPGTRPVARKGIIDPAIVGREDRTACGNPECASRWKRLHKGVRRPIFEERWGCSSRCVKMIVASAVRRELGEVSAMEEDVVHSHRLPLGLILLQRGWITHPQLKLGLDLHRRAGKGQIGRVLVEQCGLEEELITRALSAQWGCAALTLERFDPEAVALTLPRMLVQKLGLVPLRIAAERILYLAFEDRMDASAAFALERMSGLKVESGLLAGSQLQAARERLLECEFIESTHERVADAEALSAKIAGALGTMQPRASRLVRVHQFYWLRMWLESGAMGGSAGGVPVSKEDVVDRLFTLNAG